MPKEFEASKPIYLQIAEYIFQKIVRREINPGDKLPSVRELAILLGVNPNTIQRTYSEMERMGIVETKRGQGTFIINNNDIVIGLKQTMQQDLLRSFVKSMKNLGFTELEIVNLLKEYLKEGDEN